VPPSVRTVVRRVVPHSVYRRYRRRKIASLISGYTPHDVEHLYSGHALRVHLADPLAEGWYDRDWPEWEIVRFLRDRDVLAAGGLIFDLGAHQAVVALLLARHVGDDGRVVAVEAEPHNARVANVNRELNGAENLTVIHAAAAAAEGSATFAEGLNGVIDKRTTAGNVKVPAVSIDGLTRKFGTPNLVFIDVEGYEGEVLRGAQETLANGTTSFAVEVHATIGDYGDSPAGIVECFRDFDRYVAKEDDEPLLQLDGPPPSGRFFLVAMPRHAPVRP
jgi:FkbM family methyltransferase